MHFNCSKANFLTFPYIEHKNNCTNVFVDIGTVLNVDVQQLPYTIDSLYIVATIITKKVNNAYTCHTAVLYSTSRGELG